VTRQEVLRARQIFEKANPKPITVLGPVPSLKQQIAELTQNPATVLQIMQREAKAQELGIDQDDPDWMDWDDDEPEMLTGYEVADMEDYRPPQVDSNNSLENQQPTGDNESSIKEAPDDQVPENRPLEQSAG